jgi:type VI secretion system protein ImpA
MSSIDRDALLRDVSTDAPSGPNLEYDAEFLEMSRAAAGKPAQEMGGQVIPGEEPDWKDVRNRCSTMFGRTKDLRVAVPLVRALLHTDGLPGLADGLGLVQALVKQHWATLHPQLDPDDHNDPTFRMNAVAGLADRDQMILPLRAMPIARSRRVGRFSLRDYEISNGTLPKPEGEPSADTTTINAAFLDMDAPELQADSEAVTAAIESLKSLEGTLAEAVGSTASADFSVLRATLKSMHVLLQEQMSRRGLGAQAPSALQGDGVDAPLSDAASGGVQAMTGTIQSREDVIRVLDQCCDWYARNEPGSPVPLLLRRAKRLVSKSFIELVQDLSPSGLTEVQTIVGLDSQS